MGSSHQICLPGSTPLRQWHPAAPTTSTARPSVNSRAGAGIIAAATGGSSGVGPSSLEALQKMKVPELKERCKALGLPVTGNKPDLIERMFQATQQQQDEDAWDEADTSPAQTAADAADAAEEDISREELVPELIMEISDYSDEMLAACLSDRGLSQEGDWQERVERLAQAVADET